MLKSDIIESIEEIDANAWDALSGHGNPFVEHGFLSALERSGSVGSARTGWIPRHVVVRDRGRLVGAAPTYLKLNSWGEYIFDWSWAQAAARTGIPYYPKVVVAVPFTPVTGQRLLAAPESDRNAVARSLVRGVKGLADAHEASSMHFLFVTEAEQAQLGNIAGLMSRKSYQFHWARQPEWQCFEDYLGALRAPNRKQVRRERQRAQSHGLRLCMKPGVELTRNDWQALWTFYRITCGEKGGIPYLTAAFFEDIAQRFAHRAVAALAYRGQTPVAGALFFTKGPSLYGRYWGAIEPFDALHFELCYYMPIAWCLERGLERFEAGAQGSHKIKRGLLPQSCHSSHWIRHPGLREAIDHFLPHEAEAITEDMVAYGAHTPFKRTAPAPNSTGD